LKIQNKEVDILTAREMFNEIISKYPVGISLVRERNNNYFDNGSYKVLNYREHELTKAEASTINYFLLLDDVIVDIHEAIFILKNATKRKDVN